jgi:predicted membrane-bound mannosyltransferase
MSDKQTNKLRMLLSHGAVSPDREKKIYDEHGIHAFDGIGNISSETQTHILHNPIDPGDAKDIADFSYHPEVLHKAVDLAVAKKDPDMAEILASRNTHPETQKRMFDSGSHFMTGPLNAGNPTADQLHQIHKNVLGIPEHKRSWNTPYISEKNIGAMHTHTLQDINKVLGTYSGLTHKNVRKELERREFDE